MFDYRQLEALTTVWEEGGFEKAADKLCITQSAVSQRIKALEEQAGQILISRANPPEPNEKGRELINHCRRVRLLEGDMGRREKHHTLRIGINADSLATWFMDGAEEFYARGIPLELRVGDQEKTLEMLRAGDVAGCIASDDSKVSGCSRHFLGTMSYVLICSRNFRGRWFPRGLTEEEVREAPAAIFNRDDRLNQLFLEKRLPPFKGSYPAHYIPSAEQYLDLIERGHAYGAVPLMQCGDRLGRSLVELSPERIGVDLYWHCWNLDTTDLKRLTELLMTRGRELIL
ncbi:MAG: LysR family transcriptional regulator ArgP [Spirochaetales bacterium]|nr:LysR family transcriptional regulator ArgP [Spirochaetales bacterium]